MKGIKLTEGQKQQIMDLAEQGYKNREIVEMTGRSLTTVIEYAKEGRAKRKTKEAESSMPAEWIREWDALHEKYGTGNKGKQERRPEWKDRMLQTFLAR